MKYEALTFEIPELAGISRETIDLHLGLYAGYVKHVNLINDKIASYSHDLEANTYAIAEMQRSGVPASITLAQGILESAYGESDLCKQSNNHFGIKCKTEWTGEKVYHDDDTNGECFRSYACAADSYKDHSDFLRTRAWYDFLFKIEPTDYTSWAKGLK